MMIENTNTASLYIVLISVHGLIRGRNLELGRDADTGGQTKYVVELAKALAKQPNVERVDLITRRIIDSEVIPITPSLSNRWRKMHKLFALKRVPKAIFAKKSYGTIWIVSPIIY